MSRIEKTIARQKQKIEEGQFYEAHQQIRVIASRYVKQESFDAAIDILSSGALLLLKANQGGSGGDLCLCLMEVYNKAELKSDSAAKGRLLALLRSYPPDEPIKKRFVGEMIAWSSKFGEYPAGDPELHHVAGKLYAESECVVADGNVYEAEKHLTLGTKDSPPYLATLEYDWYASDEAHTAGIYAARAIFPYLLVGNLRAAHPCLLLFTSRLGQSTQNLTVQEVSSTHSDIHVYPSIPLLNFLGLLLKAIQRGSSDLFRSLNTQYFSDIAEVGTWDASLEQIGEMYFGIRKLAKSNPMMDMLGSMFMGGGRASPKPNSTGKADAPGLPPAVD